MKRVYKLKKESKESNEDNNTTSDVISTNSIDNHNDINITTESESKKGSNQLQYQIAEEKAAAKIFPLNLLSSRFKSKDPNALKGRYQSCAINLRICVRLI